MTQKILSFIVVETARAKRGGKELVLPPPGRSAPHYFEKSVPSQYVLGDKETEISGRKIKLIAKSYHPDAILIEGSIEVGDIFGDKIIEFKDKLHDACYEYAEKLGGKTHPAEEYTIYQISEYKGDPEELFVKKYREKIAALLKSEKIELDEKEIDHTLSFQFRYSKNDLVIVDWDGAFVFDPDGEVGEIIELMELANYQLLRYRILDETIDQHLQKISQIIEPKKRRFTLFNTSEVNREFLEIIKVRSDSISQFEAMERDIKLIGDWYLARLHDLLSKKFRLDGWREIIREKLESIKDVYSIAAENFGLSRTQRLELIQIWGFFILQIGWLVLIVLEFIQLAKN